jgi:transcription antitermination factor NusG
MPDSTPDRWPFLCGQCSHYCGTSNDRHINVTFAAWQKRNKIMKDTTTMAKKKFKLGDKVKIVTGKYIGRTGECRRDTDKGQDMGHMMLAGDMCDRKLRKTSAEVYWLV